MTEPACLNGTLDCAELLGMLNAGLAIAGATAVILAIFAGMAIARGLWVSS